MNTQKTFNRLFLRLQLQARLKEISDQLGHAGMLAVLAEAIQSELRRHEREQDTQ
jgi:hypothetical protein